MEDRELKEKVGNSTTLLVRTDPEKHFDTILNTLKKLQEDGYHGVYLSFQRPAKSLKKSFRKENLEDNDIFIIDMATELERKDHQKQENTVFLSPETGIDTINRNIYRQIKNLKGNKKFLLLDSLDTPVLYRPQEDVLKLAEFIVLLRKFDPDIKIILNTSKNISGEHLLRHISKKIEEIVR